MKRAVLLSTAAALALSLAAPIMAQPAPTTAPVPAATDSARRLDRIERELRAVQRRVFPGAQDGLFQPEVTPGEASVVAAPGTTPVADINSRIDAVEAQLARMTDQVEQQGFRQRELEASIARLRTDLAGRIGALETAGSAAAGPAAVAVTPPPIAVTPAPTAPRPAAQRPAATPAPRATGGPAPAAAASNAERRARVAAIEVPSSGNAAEDSYLYGYRLWDARLYPEAQAQLQKVIDDHPTHRRASYAGNLLGRAFLDNNQPSLAVRPLYDNYRNRPRGERAADSVYFMGVALIRLNRNADACRTFDEFDRAYGTTASDTLKAQVVTARSQARC